MRKSKRTPEELQAWRDKLAEASAAIAAMPADKREELAAEYGMSRDAVIKVRQRVRKRLEGLLTSTVLEDLESD